jgi:hypothetical protein
MKRRRFITLLGGAAVAWPLAARAAAGNAGDARAPGDAPHLLATVCRGLKDTGFVEGQKVVIECPFLRLLCQVQQRRNGSVQSFNRSRTACIGNRFPRPRGDERNGYPASQFATNLSNAGYRNGRST